MYLHLRVDVYFGTRTKYRSFQTSVMISSIRFNMSVNFVLIGIFCILNQHC
ncbi:unnamed protein product [Schistosoma margrebowiei]|uniref:Uncharacterized protein n=1 Tax=Schistosoma margrebowiei TaxID=48269 RepID=A0A183M1X4_9TREM|nr:unnamed protein product [Schistosoma margrebowiei]